MINPISQNVDNSNNDDTSDIDSDYTLDDVGGSDCEDVYSDFGIMQRIVHVIQIWMQLRNA